MKAPRAALATALALGAALLAAPAAEAAPAFTAFATGLSDPRGVALDVNGNLYVAEAGNARIRKYDKNGNLLATIGSTGSGNGQMQQPTGVAVDAAGNIYFADRGNKHVQKLLPDGTFVRDFGFFADPAGVEVDDAGHVLVTDLADDILVKLAPDGTLIQTYGRPGGGAGSAPGQFNDPYDVDTDPSGDFLVADFGNDRIQRLDPFGQPVPGWTSPAAVTEPAGVDHDLKGHVWTTDNDSGIFRELDASGTVLQTLGSPGAGLGQFNQPYGIAVDCLEAVFVADSANGRVQRYGEPVDPVAPPCVAPANTRSPEVDGNAVPGSTLALDPGDWTGAPAPTLVYRWQRCATLNPESCGDILGQRGLTYTVTDADRGSFLRALVIGTNVLATVAQATDNTPRVPTLPVDPLPPVPPNPPPTPVFPSGTVPPTVQRTGFSLFTVGCPTNGPRFCGVDARVVGRRPGGGRVQLASASGQVTFDTTAGFRLSTTGAGRRLAKAGYNRGATLTIFVDEQPMLTARMRFNAKAVRLIGRGA